MIVTGAADFVNLAIRQPWPEDAPFREFFHHAARTALYGQGFGRTVASIYVREILAFSRPRPA